MQDPVNASPAVLVKRYNISQQKHLELQLTARQDALQRSVTLLCMRYDTKWEYFGGALSLTRVKVVRHCTVAVETYCLLHRSHSSLPLPLLLSPLMLHHSQNNGHGNRKLRSDTTLVHAHHFPPPPPPPSPPSPPLSPPTPLLPPSFPCPPSVYKLEPGSYTSFSSIDAIRRSLFTCQAQSGAGAGLHPDARHTAQTARRGKGVGAAPGGHLA